MKLLHTFFSIILVGSSLAVRISHNHSQRDSAVVVTYQTSQPTGAGQPQAAPGGGAASPAAASSPAPASAASPGQPGTKNGPGPEAAKQEGPAQGQVVAQQGTGLSGETSGLAASGTVSSSSSGSETDLAGKPKGQEEAAVKGPAVPPAKVPEVPKKVVPEKKVPVPAQKTEEEQQNEGQQDQEKQNDEDQRTKEKETLEKAKLEGKGTQETQPSDVNLPKADIDVSGPKVDVDISGPKVESSGPQVDVNLPKADIDISGPKVDLQAPQSDDPSHKADVDVSVPKVEGDLKGPKADVDVSVPKVEGELKHGEQPSGSLKPEQPQADSPGTEASLPSDKRQGTEVQQTASGADGVPQAGPEAGGVKSSPTPKEPAPTSPKEPEPTTKEPAPTTPKQPAPAEPKEPAPTTPKEPAPTSPKEPAPTDPKEPAPAEPKEPAPTTPKAKLQPESHEENIKLRPDQIQKARENEGILHVTHGESGELQRDEASSSSGVTNGVTTQVPISQTSVEHPPAPAKPTLETLVGSGTICHKQQILSHYLQNEISHGPMKETFNPMTNTPQVLQKCREMSRKKPSVCKSGTLTTQPLCATLNLTKTIGNYFTYGVCTVEAALNQMYHKRYTGTFIANDMNYYMTILKKVSTFMPEAQKTYGDSLKILEHLQKLFLDAEQALISPEVQAVLYKRWSLLDTVLCGIASGSQNEVLDNVNANSADQTAEAVVDLEDFIYQATNVFMKAYEPFVELVSVLQKQVLKAALELNKEEFANKVRELLKNIAEKHNPLIPVGSLEIMKQIPHAGLDAKEVQAVASSMPSVSLVQRNSRSSTSQNEDTVTATEAINTALLSVNIFKVKDNSVLPEMDVDRVKAMVREALLNLSEEEMVAKLIVQPQAAIRVFYDTLISLVPLPNSDKNWVQENKIWLAQFANIANVVEEKFNAARHAISGLAQQRPTSMLQVKNDAPTGRFLIQSRPGGANIETAVSTFVEPLPFQQKLEPMAYVKAFSNATFAGTVGVIFIAVFSIM
eukprot:XP_001609412.1 hypothetical protein [Babesia bovis T2Bo]